MYTTHKHKYPNIPGQQRPHCSALPIGEIPVTSHPEGNFSSQRHPTTSYEDLRWNCNHDDLSLDFKMCPMSVTGPTASKGSLLIL